MEEGTTATMTDAPAQEAGQAEGVGAVSPNTSEGQGEGTASGKTEQAVTEAPGGGTEDSGQAEEAKWDGDTMKWLASKGYDHTAYDPKNETHAKTLKQLRALESEATRRRQEEAAQKALSSARKAAPIEEEADEGPLAKYEESYNADVQKAFHFYRVRTAEDLYQKAPDVYEELEKAYVVGRQKAWEEHQEWKVQQEQKKAEQDRLKKQYFEDFEKAKSQSKEILNNLKKDFPNLDKNFARYGVNALTDTLAEKYSVFPEMLFLDDKVARFFADAAEAIAYRYEAPEREKKLIEEYEKKKIKLAEASGPRPSGTSSSTPVNPHGKGTWLATLDKHSHEFQK